MSVPSIVWSQDSRIICFSPLCASRRGERDRVRIGSVHRSVASTWHGVVRLPWLGLREAKLVPRDAPEQSFFSIRSSIRVPLPAYLRTRAPRPVHIVPAAHHGCSFCSVRRRACSMSSIKEATLGWGGVKKQVANSSGPSKSRKSCSTAKYARQHEMARGQGRSPRSTRQ